MSTNQFNTVDELISGVLNHGPDIISLSLIKDFSEIRDYLSRLADEHLNYPIPKTSYDINNWFIPESYKDMDIKSWVLSQCKTPEELERVSLELELYQQHGMIPVLNTMKYIVDTLRANNVVWGVGRGSSVASYVLYLIGVHKINSIKYSLPIDEFFKGEQNG